MPKDPEIDQPDAPAPPPKPRGPEPVFTRAEILGAAESYGTTLPHVAAALHLLGRPEQATRSDVEAALKKLDTERLDGGEDQ